MIKIHHPADRLARRLAREKKNETKKIKADKVRRLYREALKAKETEDELRARDQVSEDDRLHNL